MWWLLGILLFYTGYGGLICGILWSEAPRQRRCVYMLCCWSWLRAAVSYMCRSCWSALIQVCWKCVCKRRKRSRAVQPLLVHIQEPLLAVEDYKDDLEAYEVGWKWQGRYIQFSSGVESDTA